MDLETRVRWLEAQVKILFVGLIMLIVGWVAIGAKSPPEYLTVRGLTVVDDNGQMRASIFCSSSDVQLTLWDADSQPRLSSVCKDGGTADLLVSAGKNKGGVILSTRPEGSVLRVSDTAQESTEIICRVQDDTPTVRIKNKADKVIWSVP